MAVEQRGKLAAEAQALLEVLAQDAAMLADGDHSSRPLSLVRRWRRAIELVLAFENGEVLRAVADGRA